MAENSDYILELLTEYGMVSAEQIEEGWSKVAASDGRLDIVDALLELHYIDESEVMAMLAQQYDGNYALASRGVAVSTILSVITMPIVAMITGL